MLATHTWPVESLILVLPVCLHLAAGTSTKPRLQSIKSLAVHSACPSYLCLRDSNVSTPNKGSVSGYYARLLPFSHSQNCNEWGPCKSPVCQRLIKQSVIARLGLAETHQWASHGWTFNRRKSIKTKYSYIPVWLAERTRLKTISSLRFIPNRSNMVWTSTAVTRPSRSESIKMKAVLNSRRRQ